MLENWRQALETYELWNPILATGIAFPT